MQGATGHHTERCPMQSSLDCSRLWLPLEVFVICRAVFCQQIHCSGRLTGHSETTLIQSFVRSHRRSQKRIENSGVTTRKPVFQIRSSLAQFPMRERFVRLDLSISSVFSIGLN